MSAKLDLGQLFILHAFLILKILPPKKSDDFCFWMSHLSLGEIWVNSVISVFFCFISGTQKCIAVSSG